MTPATALARTLHEAGVRYVFGHPGGEVVDLIEAMEQQGLKFVLTHHESAAAFMAGAIGRLSGTPGVCLSTLGPGACNLVLGVACAWLDRDPLLALSARTGPARERVSNKQNLSLNDVFTPVTKWSVALAGHGTAQSVSAALSLAQTPPRGPVYLSMPAEIAVGEETAGDALMPPPPQLPVDGTFESLSRALNAARRPVGVVGLALDAERDSEAVRRFFAQTALPFVVLPQAKGVADERSERYLGTVASAAGDAGLVDFLNQSDCLLGIGFDPVESSQAWHLSRPLYVVANGPVGYCDFQPTGECIGDVSRMLDELARDYDGVMEWQPSDLQAVRQGVADALQPKAESSNDGLSPFHLMTALREIVPEETIVTTDVGAHKVLMAQTWRAPHPNSFLVSNGLSAMGYGVPSALAACLLNPSKPVLAVVGDGGFAMMASELETARRMGVAPCIVVCCDRSLAVIKIAQDERRLPHRGTDFGAVDWAQVAEGYGVRGGRATTLAEVQRAVGTWLARREPTVIAVSIDENLYAGLTY